MTSLWSSTTKDGGAVTPAPSGIERAGRPRRVGRGPAILQPVVQAERAVLPELDQHGFQAEARPVRRPRHLADDVPGGVLGDALLQGEPALQRPRLVGGPGADLAAAVATGETRRRPPRPWSAPPALPGAPGGAATSSGTAWPPWDGPAGARPCGSHGWCRRRSREASKPFSSTIRTAGVPSGPTVARLEGRRIVGLALLGFGVPRGEKF